MRIQIRLFATHREKLGTDRVALDLPTGASVSDLLDLLVRRSSDFERAGGATRVAVNREYASPDTILHDGDEVALIPPVAGGNE